MTAHLFGVRLYVEGVGAVPPRRWPPGEDVGPLSPDEWQARADLGEAAWWTWAERGWYRAASDERG